MGATVDRTTLGQMMGLTAYAIRELVKAGAPVIRHGSRGETFQFDTAAFLEFYIEHSCRPVVASEYDQAKTRGMIAHAERVEALNATAKANTVSVDEAVAVYKENADETRAALNAIPAAIAAALAAETNASVAENIVADGINDALRALNAGEEI